MLSLGFIVLFGGMLLGLPFFLTFSMQAIIHSFGYLKIPLMTVPQLMFSAVDNYVLMAMVFYMLSGFILRDSGLSDLLINMVDTWIRHVPCGLGWVMCVATMFFGAMTASGGAATYVIGVVMIPRMVAAGYPKRFCIALISSVNQLGALIPPSIQMIVYGYITESSVAALFIAGIVPGIVFLLVNGTTATIWERRASRRGEIWGKMPPASWHERRIALFKALPVLTFPVVIIGGIYGGFFSPTESALVATLHAVLLALAYGRFSLKSWRDTCKEALRIMGMLYFLIAAVIIFGRTMTFARIPHMLTEAIIAMGLSYEWFVLAIIVLYIIIGFMAEGIVIQFVTIPILFPVVIAMGMDPIQFGVVICLAIGLASTTPPVGTSIFTAAAIFDEPVGPLFIKVIPFDLAQIAALVIVAYIPALSLWLPRLAGLYV